MGRAVISRRQTADGGRVVPRGSGPGGDLQKADERQVIKVQPRDGCGLGAGGEVLVLFKASSRPLDRSDIGRYRRGTDR